MKFRASVCMLRLVCELLQVALKEMSDYWKGILILKVVWRSARTILGAQCVIADGTTLMPE